MLFRKTDGTLIDIKKNNFKNDFLYYSNVMNIKAQKETKQKNIQTAFIVNESAKRTNYSKQSIEKLLQEF
jgi:hypothetical protein